MDAVNRTAMSLPFSAAATVAPMVVASVAGTPAGVRCGASDVSRFENPVVRLLIAVLAFVLAVDAVLAVVARLVPNVDSGFVVPPVTKLISGANNPLPLDDGVSQEISVEMLLTPGNPANKDDQFDNPVFALVFAVEAVEAVDVRLVPNVVSGFVVPPVTKLIRGAKIPLLLVAGLRNDNRLEMVLTPGNPANRLDQLLSPVLAFVFAVDAVDAVPSKLVLSVDSGLVVPPVTRLINGANRPALLEVGCRNPPNPVNVLTPGIRPSSGPKIPLPLPDGLSQEEMPPNPPARPVMVSTTARIGANKSWIAKSVVSSPS